MFTDAFDAFYKFSGGAKRYPERIIIYREGVGEGQAQALIDQEVPQIKAAIDSIPEMKGKRA